MIKGRIKSLYGNKDVRVMAENFAYLSLLQVAGYVFPLITLPYLSRVIGLKHFGEIAFASAIMIYFKTVVDYGFNFVAVRDISQNRADDRKVSEIFSYVTWARILLMLVTLVVLIALIVWVPKFNGMGRLMLYSFLMIPGYIMFPEWLFQGLERMKYITFLSLIAKLLFTVSVFIFVRKESDYVLQPLLMAAGYFVSGIIALYIITKKYNIALLKPSFPKIWDAIKCNTDVFINQLMPNLYKSFSTLLLGFRYGDISNGILDAGSRFVDVSQQLMNVVARTFFPYLSRRIDKHRYYSLLNFVLSCLIALTLFFGAPLIIRLFFSEEFMKAVPVLRILSVSIIFLSLTNVYGTSYLIIQKHERELRNMTVISSIIGFCIAWPLIYLFDFIGAAVTICVTRGLLALMITVKALVIKKRVRRSTGI